jgi:hypothetical protein
MHQHTSLSSFLKPPTNNIRIKLTLSSEAGTVTKDLLSALIVLTAISSHQHPLFPTFLEQEQTLARRLHRTYIFMQTSTSTALVDEQTEVQNQNTSRPNLICQPLPNDVLFGRGRPLQAHYGNLRFHRIINKFREEYKNARKDEKVGTAEK